MLNLVNKRNLSATLGNVIEWYDFSLYGYFAPILAQSFFPSQNEYMSLMAVFLTFALSYLMRPIGGILFGHLGDTIGYGKSLYYAINTIIIPTLLIGLLPTYSHIGYYATFSLIGLRLLQGISAGGQYSGSLTYLTTENPSDHSAKAASLSYSGSLFGFLLASIISMCCMKWLPSDIAWRIPFLLSATLIPITYTCHKHLTNSAPPPCAENNKLPLQLLLSQYKAPLIKSSLLACIGNLYYNCFFIFTVSYLNVYLKMRLSTIYALNTLCLISSGFLVLYFAKLADQFGRKKILLASSLAITVLTLPAFYLLNTKVVGLVGLGLWLLTSANTAYMAASAAVYVELFPPAIRFTGCALSYNLGSGIVGGFTPFFLLYLLHHCGQYGLLTFLSVTAILAVGFTAYFIPETLKQA